jgi:hypothetical protein
MLTSLFVLAAIVPSASSAAEPDFKKIADEVAKAPHVHPYLIFSAEEKPAIVARIHADPRQAEVMEKLRLEGRRLLQAPVEPAAPPREIHTRYLETDEYRRYVGRAAEAALTLAFLYQMTGDAHYAEKAFEHASVVAAQESWVQSAHTFDVIYPRVWPFGAKDDQVVFSYDISAAGMTQRMAYVYDWLYPALRKAQRDRLRGALLEKAITRVRGSYEYLWWSTAYKCNWSGICHSGLGLAALALLDEDPQLADVVARSSEGVWNMLDHIGEDGGWQEGRGYWAYGVGESVMFIDALKRASGGRLDMFKHRGLYPHPLDFALFGLTGGFADGTGFPVGNSHVLNKLTEESGDPRAAWYTQRFVHSMEGLFDLIWPATTVKAEKPAESSRFFKSIDWAVLRKDFGPASLTVAAKAGLNDDPHHGHLDCGTFNLTWHNLSYVGEVPRGSYDEEYFGALRWDYLKASTLGHNVVMVNGEAQVPAKLKDQPWQTGIGGHITQYRSEPDWGYVSMDPTHAYPGKALELWKRTIVLDKERNIAIVLDTVRAAAGSTIEVRFHPRVEADVKDDRVVLRGVNIQSEASLRGEAARDRAAGRSARPETEYRSFGPTEDEPPSAEARRAPDMQMLPLVRGGYKVVQGRQPDMPVTEEAHLTWVPYFSTVVAATAEPNVIASVFYPAALAGKAGDVFKLQWTGGHPAVSCALEGKTVQYAFRGDVVERSID